MPPMQRAQATDAVLDHIGPGTQLIVPLANGEPTAVLDAIEAASSSLSGVGVHQMHALHDREYLAGHHLDRLRHVSYFLSHVTRPHFAAGGIDLVPAHFSEVFALMRARTTDPLVIAAASPPDRHGYFSLGVSADYTSSFIGRARVFLDRAGPVRPTPPTRTRSPSSRCAPGRCVKSAAMTGPFTCAHLVGVLKPQVDS